MSCFIKLVTHSIKGTICRKDKGKIYFLNIWNWMCWVQNKYLPRKIFSVQPPLKNSRLWYVYQLPTLPDSIPFSCNKDEKCKEKKVISVFNCIYFATWIRIRVGLKKDSRESSSTDFFFLRKVFVCQPRFSLKLNALRQENFYKHGFH